MNEIVNYYELFITFFLFDSAVKPYKINKWFHRKNANHILHWMYFPVKWNKYIFLIFNFLYENNVSNIYFGLGNIKDKWLGPLSKPVHFKQIFQLGWEINQQTNLLQNKHGQKKK